MKRKKNRAHAQVFMSEGKDLQTILLCGATGQIGSTLFPLLSGLFEKIDAPTSKELNFLTPDTIGAYLEKTKPSIIVNAAAYTDVEKAEKEPDKAMRCNAQSPYELALWAKRNNTLLVHYSSDYVFDGTKQTPYTETDAMCPLNSYGHSKKIGDENIIHAGCRHIILRTAWVYKKGHINFPQKILAKATKGEPITVVTDQIGAPTSAETVARGTITLLKKWINAKGNKHSCEGLYHLSSSGETSWYDFAREILKDKSAALASLTPIMTAQLEQAACARPLNSRLSTTKITKAFSLTLPTWIEDYRETR